MNKSLPLIRFSGFDSNWMSQKISDLVDNKVIEKPMDGNHGEIHPKASDYVSEGIPFIMANDILNGSLNLNSCKHISKELAESLRKGFSYPGDVLLTHKGSVGNTALVPFLCCDYIMLTPQVTYYRVVNNNLLSKYFLKLCFESPAFKKKLKIAASSGTRPYVGITEQTQLTITLPQIEEQQKIADFLMTVDKKISLLKEKYALLEQYKKGVMQKLFKQEIRFKDDSGNEFPDWQSRRFEEVFVRITRKNKEDNQNVLTISAQMGLVNQEKYFNKSVSAKDLTGYYLLENGDFAYNKSYSKGYPMGAIKRLNNYDKGVVSTLYICFRVVGEQEPLFWEQFFEAGLLNREINKIAQEGARNHGLLNVSVTEFFNDIEVPVPSRAEQRKIADFLCVLDKKLNSVKEQIDLTQTFKTGLLQQMFV